MRFGTMFLAAVVTAGAATAASAAPGLSAKGEGRWEVQCQVVADGEPKTVILAPDTPAYAHPKLTRAACDYRAGAGGDLTISLTEVAACPFEIAAAGACALTAPKSKRGSFSFRIPRGR